MALTLTIGGVVKTSLLHAGSLRITDELNTRNTCGFTLIDEAGTYRPIVGQVVSITNGGVTIFGGTIDSVKEREIPGNIANRFEVTCVDYNQIVDRHRVAREYLADTIGDIVVDIVTQDLAGEGITVQGSVAGSGPTITRILFNYATVAEAFNELAQLIGYYWNIGYDKVLSFTDRATNAAPFDLTDSNEKFLAGSMLVETTRAQYRNRQYLRAGYERTNSRTEDFAGESAKRSFTLIFPVALEPSVTVDTGGGPVAKTIGIRGIDTGKDWYYQKNDQIISQDDGGTVLAPGDRLHVTYQGLYPLSIMAQDDLEIAGRVSVEGGTGVYEDIENEPNIDGGDLAYDKAMGILQRYGVIPRIVTYETDSSGLASGQLQSINITRHNIDAYYLIDKVDTRDVDGINIRYAIRAVSGESLGSWYEFFRKMAAAGKQWIVRENEVLVLIRRFSDAVALTDTDSYVSAARESRVGTALVGYSEADTYTIDGLVLHLDASAITGLNHNDNVTTWLDLSGMGYNAVQSTASWKPIYWVDDGAGDEAQNGLAVVRFDGVNDEMTIPFVLGAATDFTIFLGIVSRILKNYDAWFGHWSDHGGPFSMSGGVSGEIFAGVSIANRIVTSTGFYTTGPFLFTLVKSGGNLSLYKNGTGTPVTAAGESNPPSYTHSLGRQSNTPETRPSGNYSKADFCRVMVYDRALTDIERTTVRDDINVQWKLY